MCGCLFSAKKALPLSLKIAMRLVGNTMPCEWAKRDVHLYLEFTRASALAEAPTTRCFEAPAPMIGMRPVVFVGAPKSASLAWKSIKCRADACAGAQRSFRPMPKIFVDAAICLVAATDLVRTALMHLTEHMMLLEVGIPRSRDITARLCKVAR